MYSKTCKKRDLLLSPFGSDCLVLETLQMPVGNNHVVLFALLRYFVSEAESLCFH